MSRFKEAIRDLAGSFVMACVLMFWVYWLLLRPLSGVAK